MKINKLIVKSFFLIVICGLTLITNISCHSVNKIEKDVIYAMVYDLDNNPVQDVSFYLDGEFVGKSDIYGRFIINDKNAQIIRAYKVGYENIEQQLGIENAVVFYFKIGTVNQLLDKAEQAFDSEKKEEALLLIERAEKIDPTREDLIYFKKIVCNKK